MLNITPAAAEQLKDVLAKEGEEGDGVRVSVYTVGKHPELQYKLDFGPRREGDYVLAPLPGLEVYVDAESWEVMCHTTLGPGPVIGGDGEGFQFIRG